MLLVVCHYPQESLVFARKSTIAPNQMHQYHHSTTIITTSTCTTTTSKVITGDHHQQQYSLPALPPPLPPPPPPIVAAATATQSTSKSNNSNNNQNLDQNKGCSIIKPSPYNIDYIVKDLKSNNNNNTQKSAKMEKRKAAVTVEEPLLAKSINTINNDNQTKFNNNYVLTASTPTTINTNNSGCDGGAMSRNLISNAFADKSSEVKHARTPSVSVNAQTHSPQLPLPSPNYPVQTQSSVMETANIAKFNSNNSNCHNNNSNSKSINLPNNNTLVPIINNNYINAPQKATSQNDLNLNSNTNNNSKRIDNQLHILHSINNNSNTTNKINNISDKMDESAVKTTETTSSNTINNANVSVVVTNSNNNNICEENTISLPAIVTTTIANQQAFTVLNIPSLHFHGPPVKRQKLSKIDVATIRRKMRRQKRLQPKVANRMVTAERRKINATANQKINTFGVSVFGYSDSSSSSSSYSSSSDSDDNDDDRRMDLWIKSGPPLKPDLNPEKMNFLKMFRLTTHINKNSVELKKLERRKWTSSLNNIIINEVKSDIVPLNLPVPSKSPSLLNLLPDYRKKSNFLQMLGLKTVPTQLRQEMEDTWMKIVEDRIKRNCESSLTKYSLKAFKQQKNDCNPNPSSIDMSFKIPIVHQYCQNLPVATKKILNPLNIKQEDCTINNNSSIVSNNKNNSIEYNYVPLTMVIVDGNNSKNVPFLTNDIKTEDEEDKSKLKWPGIQEIMESYQRYSKERNLEIEQLKSRCASLKEEIVMRQFEVKYLERRQRELHSSTFMADQERKRLQKTLDQLKNIINAFR